MRSGMPIAKVAASPDVSAKHRLARDSSKMGVHRPISRFPQRCHQFKRAPTPGCKSGW